MERYYYDAEGLSSIDLEKNIEYYTDNDSLFLYKEKNPHGYDKLLYKIIYNLNHIKICPSFDNVVATFGREINAFLFCNPHEYLCAYQQQKNGQLPLPVEIKLIFWSPCQEKETKRGYITTIDYNPDKWLEQTKEGEYIIYYTDDKGYVYVNKKHKIEEVRYPTFETKLFGKIKPKDEFQVAAMHSLQNNQFTLLRGKAGSGKSILALSSLMYDLEHGDIDKIIIFCNPVAAADSAKLGYLPGSRTEKLLDSQIGNFLSSKFGDSLETERLISNNKLLLLPMSDIRGFDTTGMRAGVYITEAQNTNATLMKLCLSRVGNDCKIVLDGDDDTQVDLHSYEGNSNGMLRVSQVFSGQPFFGEVYLPNVHRSKIAEIASQL